MKPSTPYNAQTADARRKRVAKLISDTDYIGQKYAAGTPNNSSESTASGALEMLSYMLANYDSAKAAAAV